MQKIEKNIRKNQYQQDYINSLIIFVQKKTCRPYILIHIWRYGSSIFFQGINI